MNTWREKKTLITIINVEITKADSILTAGNVFLILTAINNNRIVCQWVCVNVSVIL